MFLYNPENCKNNAQIIIQEKPARVSNIHDRPIECQVDLITKQKKKNTEDPTTTTRTKVFL